MKYVGYASTVSSGPFRVDHLVCAGPTARSAGGTDRGHSLSTAATVTMLANMNIMLNEANRQLKKLGAGSSLITEPEPLEEAALKAATGPRSRERGGHVPGEQLTAAQPRPMMSGRPIPRHSIGLI